MSSRARSEKRRRIGLQTAPAAGADADTAAINRTKSNRTGGVVEMK
jgi:hypothetical protein